MPTDPLRNFELKKYYQKEPKFNGVYSRNNLPKIKDGTYIINLDEFKSIETHWILLELKIFQKKLENSLKIKILKQIFIEYKHMIQ